MDALIILVAESVAPFIPIALISQYYFGGERKLKSALIADLVTTIAIILISVLVDTSSTVFILAVLIAGINTAIIFSLVKRFGKDKTKETK